MRVELNPVRIFKKYQGRYQASRLKRLAAAYNLNGYKRFYHFHSRKTAGTSIAKIFLSLNENDGTQLYEALASRADRQMLCDGLIFVGWDRRLIESGQYYFAFSHIPFDELDLPPQTFRFTTLRDPIERVLSHYRMLLDFSHQKTPHSSFEEEKNWLGSSFSEFLDRMPRQHLQNQLYMFSKQFDVEEAIERVSGLEHVILFDQLAGGLERLSAKTGVEVQLRHDRRGKSEFKIEDCERKRLKEKLFEEYEFYDSLKNRVNSRIG